MIMNSQKLSYPSIQHIIVLRHYFFKTFTTNSNTGIHNFNFFNYFHCGNNSSLAQTYPTLFFSIWLLLNFHLTFDY